MGQRVGTGIELIGLFFFLLLAERGCISPMRAGDAPQLLHISAPCKGTSCMEHTCALAQIDGHLKQWLQRVRYRVASEAH